MFPTDSAMGSNVSGEWLYDGIAGLGWADSLEPEARDLFRQNGFYSSLVRPGLRIISLNTNYLAAHPTLLEIEQYAISDSIT